MNFDAFEPKQAGGPGWAVDGIIAAVWLSKCGSISMLAQWLFWFHPQHYWDFSLGIFALGHLLDRGESSLTRW